MKLYFTKIITTIVLIAVFTNYIHAQASTVTNELISTQGVERLVLDLSSSNVEIKYTKGSRMVVESNIVIGTTNDKLLKYLVDGGRYSIEAIVDPSTNSMFLTRKKNNTILMVKGQECEETVSYILLLPESIKFIVKDGVTL